MNSRLASHIERTLLRHQCAVVPELGAFVLEILPASYDAISGLASPPSSALRFQPALSHQDGLLVANYADTYALSLRRARIMLEEDVSQLRKSLLEQGTCLLPHIGRLTLEEQGNLIFESEVNVSLYRDAYGLSSVTLPPLESKAKVQKPVQSLVTPPFMVSLSRRTLAAAAILFICLLTSLPWLSNTHSEEREPSFKAGFLPSPHINVGDIVNKILPKQEQSFSATASWTTAQAGHYYVIIASERSRERAETHYTEALREPSITNPSILEGKRMHRVAAATFASSAEAYRYINQLVRTSPQYRSAWVYQAP